MPHLCVVGCHPPQKRIRLATRPSRWQLSDSRSRSNNKNVQDVSSAAAFVSLCHVGAHVAWFERRNIDTVEAEVESWVPIPPSPWPHLEFGTRNRDTLFRLAPFKPFKRIVSPCPQPFFVNRLPSGAEDGNEKGA